MCKPNKTGDVPQMGELLLPALEVREMQRSSYPFIYHQIFLASPENKITAFLSGAESFIGKKWV